MFTLPIIHTKMNSTTTKMNSKSWPNSIEKHSNSPSLNPLPNYMKSTTSSSARKRQPHTHQNSKTPRNLKRKCRIIPSIQRSSNSASSASLSFHVNRHTCSSTMKDSKFPKALELSAGATEAQGTSLTKVCPYKYCSLNGHRHDCLPPLNTFLASKRKLMEAQKRMKIKGVSPFRKQSSVKEKKEVDTGQAVARTRSDLEILSLLEEVGDELFVEIYCRTQDEVVVVEAVGRGETSGEEEEECGAFGASAKDGDDLDLNSGDYVDEFDGIRQFVDCERYGDECEAEEERMEILSTDDGGVNEEIIEDCEAIAEDDTENRIEGSEVCEIDSDYTDGQSDSSAESSDELSMFGNLFNDPVTEQNVSDDFVGLCVSDSEDEKTDCDDCIELDDNEEKKMYTEEKELLSVSFIDKNDKTQTEEQEKELYTEENELLSMINSNTDSLADENDKTQTEEQEISVVDYESIIDSETGPTEFHYQIDQEEQVQQENDDCNRLKLSITRRKISEEMDDKDEINFRGPEFLPEESDGEAEKVDLRHQTIDERKNAEEWMVDYALQKAVTKLASARRRKVSLLVEAFETVTPIPLCEKPLRNVSQVYANTMSMQACN